MLPHPIIQKLNLTKYPTKLILNEPDGYSLANDLAPCDTTISANSYDLIIAFVLNLKEMITIIHQVNEQKLLTKEGYLFIPYPKKGNKTYDSFIHRDEILGSLSVNEDGYVPNSRLKFSRMVSLDDTFTIVGLKHSARPSKTTKSQCVGDYENQIPDVQALLAEYPAELAFFNALTPGYKRGWARFIFSAKQQATQTKRTETMRDCLIAGFKSHDLYRKSLK